MVKLLSVKHKVYKTGFLLLFRGENVKDDYRAYLAEAIATFALVFIGAGAILADRVSGNFGILGIAFAHGLVLMCMVYATGHISGGHVNPAVTIGLYFGRQIKAAKAFGYIVSQLIGATIAGLLLKMIYVSAPAAAHLGTPGLAPGVSFGAGVLIEAVLTFFLVFTVFGVAVDKRAPAGMYGMAIGLVLTFDILAGGVFTGASMNPARTFGPAAASGFWANHLVYWIGPVIGAIVAAMVYTKFLMKSQGGK